MLRPPDFDAGDAEAQPLADVRRRVAAPPIDLRAGAERAHGADLHLEAALVLGRHDPSTAMPCASACSSSPGTWPPRPTVRLSTTVPERAAVVDDRGLDLIADRELHRAALRVAELGGIDDRFAFAADLDERTARAERNHAPAYHLAPRPTAAAPPLRWRRTTRRNPHRRDRRRDHRAAAPSHLV